MLKQFVFVISFICLLSLIGLAQEDTSKGQKDSSQEIKKTEKSKETIAKEPWNKVCPVQGNPIEDNTPTVVYNGKVYGFCCPGCDTKFEKNPEKSIKNLSEDGKKFVGRK